MLVTIVVFPAAQRNAISTKAHFVGSLGKLITATRGLLHGLTGPIGSDLASSLPPHLTTRQHIDQLHQLIEQAAEEPNLTFCSVHTFPVVYYRNLLERVEELYQTVAQLRALMRPLAKSGVALADALRASGGIVHGRHLPKKAGDEDCIKALKGPIVNIMEHAQRQRDPRSTTCRVMYIFNLLRFLADSWPIVGLFRVLAGGTDTGNRQLVEELVELYRESDLYWVEDNPRCSYHDHHHYDKNPCSPSCCVTHHACPRNLLQVCVGKLRATHLVPHSCSVSGVLMTHRRSGCFAGGGERCDRAQPPDDAEQQHVRPAAGAPTVQWHTAHSMDSPYCNCDCRVTVTVTEWCSVQLQCQWTIPTATLNSSRRNAASRSSR